MASKKTLTLLFVAVITSIGLHIAPTYATTPESSKGTADENVWNDDRLTMVLDKFERMGAMPKGLPARFRVPPKKDHNYAKVAVSISRAENIYLMLPNFILIDSEGGEYKRIITGYKGGNFKDKHDAKSLLSFAKGAIFTSFFEVPIMANPSNIIVDFNYLESLEEENKKEEGQIKIKVTE